LETTNWEVGDLHTSRDLVRRAEKPARTEWGRRERLAALGRLAELRHPASSHLLLQALADGHADVVAGAIEILGSLGDEWAIELLVDALRQGHGERWQIAAQLERLAPAPAIHLLHLLRDPDPAVRLWAAKLIAPYDDFGETALVARTRDEDGAVRAAATEALARRARARQGAPRPANLRYQSA
jgi:HEAT repeat protein